MAYSTIPGAKAQLLTTLGARAGLSGVTVAWGAAGDLPTHYELVTLGDAVDVVRSWSGLGLLTIEENYRLQIVVEVYQEGGTQQACEERMFAIVAEVEQAIVLDLTLANVLKWGAKPGAMNPRCGLMDDGWIANVTLNIECGARIRAT